MLGSFLDSVFIKTSIMLVRFDLIRNIIWGVGNGIKWVDLRKVILEPSGRMLSSSNCPFFKPISQILRTGGQVPIMIVAPAPARALAITQPYPVESATPAIKAAFPLVRSLRIG
jgi:hypothetical protein